MCKEAVSILAPDVPEWCWDTGYESSSRIQERPVLSVNHSSPPLESMTPIQNSSGTVRPSVMHDRQDVRFQHASDGVHSHEDGVRGDMAILAESQPDGLYEEN